MEELVTRKELLAKHKKWSVEARKLMVTKSHDYAADADPFKNFRTFGELGILVRLSDKIARLQSFIENGNLLVKDESVKDTCQDIQNYAILFLGYLEDKYGDKISKRSKGA